MASNLTHPLLHSLICFNRSTTRNLASCSRRRGRKQRAAVTTVSSTAAAPIPRAVTSEEATFFKLHGHVCLSGLLDTKDVNNLRTAVQATTKTRESHARCHALRRALGWSSAQIASLSRDEVDDIFVNSMCQGHGITAFLQYFHLWRHSSFIKTFASSMGVVVAKLFDAQHVQLYGDALFLKRPGDERTGWHTDKELVPLDTDSFLTIWIPFQFVPDVHEGGTPLLFVDGSHLWNQEEQFSGQQDVAIWSHSPLNVGDVTVHHGHMLHSAPNLSSNVEDERWALAFSYFANGARRTALPFDESGESEEVDSFRDWANDIAIGVEAKHHWLPEVFQEPSQGSPPLESSVDVPESALGSKSDIGLIQCTLDANWQLTKHKALLFVFWQRFQEAEELWRVMMKQRIEQMKSHETHVMETYELSREYCRILQEWNHHDEAEKLLRSLLKDCQKSFGNSHRLTLLVARALAVSLRAQHKLGEAEFLFRAVHEIFQSWFGDLHPDTQEAEFELSECLALQIECKERR